MNFVKNKVESGIRFRALFPMRVEMDKIPQESLMGFIELYRSGNFEFCIIERTDLFLHMNEKEVSLLTFPDMNDKFDYLGFEVTDDRTINWCNEVFNHYWNSAKPFF